MKGPETLGQAKAWEEVKGQYLVRGLCHRCAALAAYGHQLGHRAVDLPCTVCRPIVDSFDLSAGGTWRKASRALLRAPVNPSSSRPSAEIGPRPGDGLARRKEVVT